MRTVLLLCLFSAGMIHAQTEVAITLDDLPQVGPFSAGQNSLTVMNKILAVLKEHEIKEVVGFVNASRIGLSKINAQSMQAWLDAGHVIANHTWSHPNLEKISAAKYIAEIKKNENFLVAKYPGKFRKIFRYPFLREGNTLEKRNVVRNYLSENGYKVAQVTLDFNDHVWNYPYIRCLKKNADNEKVSWLKETLIAEANENLRGAELMAMQLFNRPIKHISLFHPFQFTTQVMDDVLTRWKKTGVKFISLTEAMTDPVYEIDPADPTVRWTILNQIKVSRKLENPPEVAKIYAKTDALEKIVEGTCR